MYKAVFLLGKVAAKNAKILKTLPMKQPSIYMEYPIILGIALIKQCALTQDISQTLIAYYVPIITVVRRNLKIEFWMLTKTN